MSTVPQTRNPAEPSRILVRGVNWLGDAVMTTPALQRLRQRFPQGLISILTSEHLAPLWSDYLPVDRVITFRSGEGLGAVARRLRGNFDAALLFPNSPRSALEAWLAGIPQRIGYARPWRNWLLTRAIPPRPVRDRMHKRTVREIRNLLKTGQTRSPAVVPAKVSDSQAHQIYEYLGLAAALGADPAPLSPKLEVLTSELSQAEAAWLAPRPHAILFGLNPSAAYGPAKRWPAENFAAVASQVSKKVEHSLWLLFGAATDRQLCDDIALQSHAPTLNLAGKTSLRDFMALLKLCRVLLTNDSGPMHLAAALGTPVVVPFGSTSPELTGPGLPGAPGHYVLKSAVPCAPCFRRACPIDFRCMQNITVDDVVSAVLHAVETRDAAPSVNP